MMLSVAIGFASVAVSIGIPVGLYMLNAFRSDIIRLHDRIDAHISNYEIHHIGD